MDILQSEGQGISIFCPLFCLHFTIATTEFEAVLWFLRNPLLSSCWWLLDEHHDKRPHWEKKKNPWSCQNLVSSCPLSQWHSTGPLWTCHITHTNEFFNNVWEISKHKTGLNKVKIWTFDIYTWTSTTYLTSNVTSMLGAEQLTGKCLTQVSKRERLQGFELITFWSIAQP